MAVATRYDHGRDFRRAVDCNQHCRSDAFTSLFVTMPSKSLKLLHFDSKLMRRSSPTRS
jgi:hypothetical protein